MTHTTEVVRYEKRSSGQFEVVIRCCGSPSTDWAHLMAAEVAADAQKRADSIQKNREQCADLHEKALQAEQGMLQEMGKKVEHGN